MGTYKIIIDHIHLDLYLKITSLYLYIDYPKYTDKNNNFRTSKFNASIYKKITYSVGSASLRVSARAFCDHNLKIITQRWNPRSWQRSALNGTTHNISFTHKTTKTPNENFTKYNTTKYIQTHTLGDMLGREYEYTGCGPTLKCWGRWSSISMAAQSAGQVGLDPGHS